MSKAVMISIRPKWCEKICSGEKTNEVRKTRPKMETPFKCYIYCTKAEERLIGILKDGDENYGEIYHGKPVFIKTDEGSVCDMWGKRQKVIGEFVCEEIVEIDGARRIQSDVARPTCLEPAELHKYLGVAVGYGWHISNLKVYDEPKELGEFKGLCKVESDCCACPYYNYSKMDCDGRTIKRPPQSWCYVEATKDV
jgi:predicted transcriptional regulator